MGTEVRPNPKGLGAFTFGGDGPTLENRRLRLGWSHGDLVSATGFSISELTSYLKEKVLSKKIWDKINRPLQQFQSIQQISDEDLYLNRKRPG